MTSTLSAKLEEEQIRKEVLHTGGVIMLDFSYKGPYVIYELQSTLLRKPMIPQSLHDRVNDMIIEGNLNEGDFLATLFSLCSDEDERLLYQTAFEILMGASSLENTTPAMWQSKCHKHAMEFIIADHIDNLCLETNETWDPVNIDMFSEIHIKKKNIEEKKNSGVTIPSSKPDYNVAFQMISRLTDLETSFAHKFLDSIERQFNIDLFTSGKHRCLPMIVAVSKTDYNSWFEAENDIATSICKMLIPLQVIGATELPVLGIAMVGSSWRIYLAVYEKRGKFDMWIFYIKPIWQGMVTKFLHVVESCSILKSYASWMDSTAKDAISQCLKNLKKRKTKPTYVKKKKAKFDQTKV